MSRMKKTAEGVVQDQQTLDRPERLEAVEAIQIGIAAVDEGRFKPARRALAELQEASHFGLR